jgi:transposase
MGIPGAFRACRQRAHYGEQRVGTFRTAGHLAAYAGIAPVTGRFGTSIRGEFPARSGNKQLKNALFRSAWIASCHQPVSTGYYARKRAEGMKHNVAVICLARRCDVIHAMLRNGTLYRKSTPGRLTKSIGTPPGIAYENRSHIG